MLKKAAILILVTIFGIGMFNFFSKSDGTNLTVEEFKEKFQEDKGVVIDVRTKDEYNAGHLAITDAQYDIINGDFQDKLPELDKDKTYYLYCRSGSRSGQAAKMMKNKGFENVYNIGGFSRLSSGGLETSR
jgi:phage shock protein E